MNKWTTEETTDDMSSQQGWSSYCYPWLQLKLTKTQMAGQTSQRFFFFLVESFDAGRLLLIWIFEMENPPLIWIAPPGGSLYRRQERRKLAFSLSAWSHFHEHVYLPTLPTLAYTTYTVKVLTLPSLWHYRIFEILANAEDQLRHLASCT